MSTDNLILLVEDNPHDVELTLREFRNCNFSNSIAVVRDGVDALAYLLGTGKRAGQEPKALPQLILLDLDLPKIGGLAILRRLRAEERTRHIPVVVLTCSHEQRDVLSSYDLGANRFIPKPVDMGQFVAAARQLGLERLVQSEQSATRPSAGGTRESSLQFGPPKLAT